MINTLNIWVIYDNPTDFPNKFVARRWEGTKATFDCYAYSNIEIVRHWIKQNGIENNQYVNCNIPTHSLDDPKIVETWM